MLAQWQCPVHMEKSIVSVIRVAWENLQEVRLDGDHAKGLGEFREGKGRIQLGKQPQAQGRMVLAMSLA